MTTTSITVDTTNKTISVSGDMAVRERVAVVLLGCSAADAAGVVLNVLNPVNSAILAVCDSFTKDGTHFDGTLDLDTDAMVLQFAVSKPGENRKFLLQVFNKVAANQSLIAADWIYVMMNPWTAEVERSAS